MAFEDWISLSYTKNSEIPRTGEVILIPHSFDDIDVWHGPNSHYTPSSFYSVSDTSTRNGKQVKRQLHPVIVLHVLHNRSTNNVRLGLLPIVSYSSPPKGRADPWDADRWMAQEATDIQRLYHLPVPATNWVPSYSPSHLGATLSFSSWKNNRPSWVIMVLIRHSIHEDGEWLRHSNGPLTLDDGINGLHIYLGYVIPSMLNKYTATAHSPNAQTNPINSNILRVSVSTVSTTESELMRSAYDDHTEQFWIHPGAPKAVLESAQRRAQASVNEKVFRWKNNCAANGVHEVAVEEDGKADLDDRLMAILEDVDVKEVLFGEEACGVNTSSNWQRSGGVNQALDNMCGDFELPHSPRKHVQVCRYMY